MLQQMANKMAIEAHLNGMNGHENVGAYLLKHGRLALRLQSCFTGICCFQHPSGKIGSAPEFFELQF